MKPASYISYSFTLFLQATSKGSVWCKVLLHMLWGLCLINCFDLIYPVSGAVCFAIPKILTWYSLSHQLCDKKALKTDPFMGKVKALG